MSCDSKIWSRWPAAMRASTWAMRPPSLGMSKRVVRIERVLHPEQVVLEPDARLREVDHGPHVGDRAADVAHDGAAKIAAFLLDELRELHGHGWLPARMNHERRPRLALRDHRCAEHFLLVVGPRVGRTDLADQAGTNAGVTRARGDIGDYLARRIIGRAGVHVRGTGGRYVVA